VRGALGTGLGDARSVFRLVSLHERVLADQLRHRVDPNQQLLDIEQLARVHITRRTLQEFHGVVRTVEGQWRTMLDAARRLYGIDVLLDSVGWQLNHGSLRPGDVDVLRHARTATAEHVAQHLDALIDGLAIPPGRAGGFIGRADYIDRVAALTRWCRDPHRFAGLPLLPRLSRSAPMTAVCCPSATW
jgi:acyl-CoA oxidase